MRLPLRLFWRPVQRLQSNAVEAVVLKTTFGRAARTLAWHPWSLLCVLAGALTLAILIGSAGTTLMLSAWMAGLSLSGST